LKGKRSKRQNGRRGNSGGGSSGILLKGGKLEGVMRGSSIFGNGSGNAGRDYDKRQNLGE
jgi:hypothetical protein